MHSYEISINSSGITKNNEEIINIKRMRSRIQMGLGFKLPRVRCKLLQPMSKLPRSGCKIPQLGIKLPRLAFELPRLAFKPARSDSSFRNEIVTKTNAQQAEARRSTTQQLADRYVRPAHPACNMNRTDGTSSIFADLFSLSFYQKAFFRPSNGLQHL